MPPSQESYLALKSLGVSSRMLVYLGEGRGSSPPEHLRNLVERYVESPCTNRRWQAPGRRRHPKPADASIP